MTVNARNALSNVFLEIIGWNPDDEGPGLCSVGNSPFRAPSSIGAIQVGSGPNDNEGLVVITVLQTQGDIGSISVNRIGFNTILSSVNGDITGDITLTTDSGATESAVMDDFAINGNILGDITIEGAPVGAVRSRMLNCDIFGSIGTPTQPSTITVETLIQDLRCGSLNANISGPNGPVEQIDDIQVLTGFGDGIFRGTIHAEEIAPIVPIQTSSLVFGDSIAAGSLIQIEEGLDLGDGEIDVPVNGLKGQIIINAANSTFDWTGSIDVGSTSLSPGYPDTAASLGGGAVGVVPFDLHGEDCYPIDGSGVGFLVGGVIADPAPSPSEPILIRHYGPIRYDQAAADAGDMPVTILGRSGGPDPVTQTNPFLNLTECFTASISTVGNDTILELTPQFQLANSSEWKITPVLSGTNPLLCDLGAGSSDPAVANYEYTFCVGTGVGIEDCEADHDANQVVDFNDLVTALFYINLPDPTCSPALPAGDVDDNGVVDFNDLVQKLFVFGTVCLPCDGSSAPPAMMAGGGGGGMPGEAAAPLAQSATGFVEPSSYPAHCIELLERCGFNTFTEYIQYVDSLPFNEQLSEATLVVTEMADILGVTQE